MYWSWIPCLHTDDGSPSAQIIVDRSVTHGSGSAPWRYSTVFPHTEIYQMYPEEPFTYLGVEPYVLIACHLTEKIIVTVKMKRRFGARRPHPYIHHRNAIW